MGNFLSSSDSQELDNLGKYTIPLSALGSIVGGVFFNCSICLIEKAGESTFQGQGRLECSNGRQLSGEKLLPR